MPPITLADHMSRAPARVIAVRAVFRTVGAAGAGAGER